MIQDNTGATPKLDEYRKQVFLGLQELQTMVDAAGGIEALFAPQLDDQGKHWITYVSAAWSCSKQAVELVSHRFEDALVLIQNGGVPLDIEWEALCVTPEQLLFWLGHERSYAAWNSHLYGSWGGSSTDMWADSFWYPALSAALKHFQSEGMLIDADMNEHQMRSLNCWLE